MFRKTVSIAALLALGSCSRLPPLPMGEDTNEGGASGAESDRATPGPMVVLAASPEQVTLDNLATLTWDVANAASCKASGGWRGERDASRGSENRYIYGETRFDLTCTGPGGSTTESVTVAIDSSPLMVNVDIEPYFVNAEGSFDVVVTVSNPGSRIVNNVVIGLAVPEFAVIDRDSFLRQGATCAPARTCTPGSSIVLPVGDMSPGTTRQLAVGSAASVEWPDGESLSFVATASADGADDAVGAESVRQGESELELRLTQQPGEPMAGGIVTYTLEYVNPGPAELPDVRLPLSLPRPATFVESTMTPDSSNDTVVWDLGTLVPLASGSIDVTLALDVSLPEGALLHLNGGAQANGAAVDAKATLTSVAAFAVVDCLTDEECGLQRVCSRGLCERPLLVELEVGPHPVVPGEMATVTVVVSNPTESSIVSGATVDIPVPVGVLGVSEFSEDRRPGSSCTSLFCSDGETVSWELGPIGPGESEVVWMTPLVSTSFSPEAEGFEIEFQAVVTTRSGATIEADRSTFLSSVRNLAVRTSTSRDPVGPGRNLTYTLDVSNRGTEMATAVVVSASIPEKVTFVGASAGGVQGSGGVEWDVGALAPGEGTTLQYTVTVDPKVHAGSVLEAETIVSSSFAPSKTVTQTRVEDPPLIANFELYANPVRPGAILFANVTVTNLSDDPVSDVEIRIPIPSGFANLDDGQLSEGTACSDSPCMAGNLLSSPLISLEPGESTIIGFNPFVDQAVTRGQLIQVQAHVGASGVSPARAGLTTRVQPDSQLAVRITDSSDFRADSDVTYTMYVVNQATQTIDSAELVVALPEGTTLLNASDGGVETDGVVTWLVGPLGSSEGTTRQLTVDVDGPGNFERRATATVFDPINPLNRATAVAVTHLVAPTLSVSTQLGPDPASQGALLHGSITVTNRNFVFFDADNVHVEIPLPIGLSMTRSSQRSPGSECTSRTFCDGGDRVRWNLGTLRPGESVVLFIDPFVTADVVDGGYLQLQAHVSATGETAVDSASTVIVGENPGLQVRAVTSPSVVAESGFLTYTIHTANQGSQTISNVTLSTILPDRVFFSGASNGGSMSGGRVEWVLGDLGPGDSTHRSVGVRLDSGARGARNGTHLTSWSQAIAGPSDTLRARALTRTPVGNSALRATLTMTPDPAAPGEQLNLSVTVTNTSSTAAVSDLQVELAVPAGLKPVLSNEISAGGTCTNTACRAGDRIQWPVAGLGPGESVIVSVTPTVDLSTPLGALILATTETTVGDRPVTAASQVIAIGSGP